MKKLLAFLMLAGMVLGLAGAASAAPPEDKGPGPNGHNEKGLCTAYFNGQKKGHEDGSPGPFGALEEDAEDDGTDEDADVPGETSIVSDVFEFCNEFGIMGNPERNGRYDCREGEDRDSPARDTDGDSQLECVANGTEDPPEEEQ